MCPALLGDRSDVGCVSIRARRKHDGLTLAEVAGLTNVGIRFLSELENGKPTVRLDKILRVVAALGLQLQIVSLSTAGQSWER